MDDLRILLDQEITPKGLKISVKLYKIVTRSTDYYNIDREPEEISSDSIVISNDELLAIAGKLD